jgi:hypothetical protein
LAALLVALTIQPIMFLVVAVALVKTATTAALVKAVTA